MFFCFNIFLFKKKMYNILSIKTDVIFKERGKKEEKMLKLKNITKIYKVDDTLQVNALENINLDFEDTGFVCILGHSGCGKTTLLNIIGGLDNYTSGDLVINDLSTKEYKNTDWDNYRNKEIGIVFQAYNLISHVSVLGNVELAMTLSGISKKEREKKAKEALIKVGLEKEINKRPNQLSGGQMQRVALARAIVNEPNIVLADEPTGALDSKTSLQVMDILKEISKDRLVITVTHNEELAYKYANRIIRLSDGKVTSDEINSEFESKKIERKEESKKKGKHTSMSYPTALGISGKNLLTKKGKTIVTSIAASFGIIGVGLVLALSNGFTNYVSRMERETLNKFPISIEKYSMREETTETPKAQLPKYPSDDKIHVVEPSSANRHINNITKDYVAYLENIDKNRVSVRYNYSVGMNVISKYKNDNGEDKYKHLVTSDSSFLSSIMSSIGGNASGWSELPVDKGLIEETYDVIAGDPLPDEEYADADNDKKYQEQEEYPLVLVVNSKNALSTTMMQQIGLNPSADKTYTFNDFLNIEYSYILPDSFYTDGQEIEKKTGFFFKDDMTYSSLADAIASIYSGSLSGYQSFMNLLSIPETDEYREVLAKAFLDSTDVSTYMDVNAFASYIRSDSFKFMSMTSGVFKSYMKNTELLKSFDAEKEKFASALVDILNKVTKDPKLQETFTKGLKTFKVPTDTEYKDLFENSSVKKRKLKIKTILRQKESTSLPVLSSGIYYPKSLTYQSLTDFGKSEVAKEFKNHLLTEFSSSENMKSAYSTIINKLIKSTESDNYPLMMEPFLTGTTSKIISLNAYKNVRKNSVVSPTDKLESYGDADSKDTSTNSSTMVSNYLKDRMFFGTDVFTGKDPSFDGHIDAKQFAELVSSITVNAKDFDSKTYVVNYLNEYNNGKSEKEKIYYTDVGGLATDTVGNIVSVISAVLIAFASVSLVVSSVMIAILIYTSVIERTKEIGILRSIGARKKDVGRLFKAEAVIIGFISGSFGVIMTYLISLPISLTMTLTFPDLNLGQIALLNPWHALLLITISTLLTYIASLIPSLIAARKDPVTCLRSE